MTRAKCSIFAAHNPVEPHNDDDTREFAAGAGVSAAAAAYAAGLGGSSVARISLVAHDPEETSSVPRYYESTSTSACPPFLSRAAVLENQRDETRGDSWAQQLGAICRRFRVDVVVENHRGNVAAGELC